jgi:hypothetical protein
MDSAHGFSFIFSAHSTLNHGQLHILRPPSYPGEEPTLRRLEAHTVSSAAYDILCLLEEDLNLSEEYHSLVDGKRNHTMRQPQYGYAETWHAPSRDMISGLSVMQAPGRTRTQFPARLESLSKAIEVSDPASPAKNLAQPLQVAVTSSEGGTLPPMEPFWFRTRSCGRSRAVTWTITSLHAWLSANP